MMVGIGDIISDVVSSIYIYIIYIYIYIYIYTDLPCAHYAGDVTIICYIVLYSMLIGPIYILHIGPLFCVLGCDLALAGSGYITSLDKKPRSYILYIGPVGILYILHI